MHSPPEQTSPSPQVFPHPPQFWTSSRYEKHSPPQMIWCGSEQHPGCTPRIVAVAPVRFSTNMSHWPSTHVAPQLALVSAGLKKVIRLEVSEALDSVTCVGIVDLPGTMKTPSLLPIGTTPPPGAGPKTGMSSMGVKLTGLSIV